MSNVKTLIPYDEENPLQARKLAADSATPAYSLYKEPIGEGADFTAELAKLTKELAKVDKRPSRLDKAYMLEGLMAEGLIIHISINDVKQLITLEPPKEEGLIDGT